MNHNPSLRASLAVRAPASLVVLSAFLGLSLVGCSPTPRGADPDVPRFRSDAAPSADDAAAGAPVLRRVAVLETGHAEGTEIVSVQDVTSRALVTNSHAGTVALVDLGDPTAPVLAAEFALGLGRGEELTSAAFHPREDWFAVAIRAADPFAPGRLEFRRGTDGAKLGSVEIGVWPDAVAVSPTGTHAIVACEGEGYVLDGESVRSAEGTIAWIDLRDGPGAATVRVLGLADQTGTPGFVAAEHRRSMDREIDLDGDGEIDRDGDGRVSDQDFEVARLDGRPVSGNEEDGEEVQVPLVRNTPEHLEPEGVAFTPDGTRAFVTLQEHNGLVFVDVLDGRVTAYVGLGTTEHAADTEKGGGTVFDDVLLALREPDGVAVTHDGRFVVTADEGDTVPKASKVKGGRPAGGGRTLSVFDAATGAFVGDTGNGLDEAAHALGLYPDKRSGHKGSEPEMPVTFEWEGVAYAAVTLERAGVVAVVSLADPQRPAVVSAAGCREGEASLAAGPEGFAKHRTADGRLFLLCANENDGSVTVFAVE